MSEPDDFASLFAPEPPSDTGTATGPSWKVLLVDDEPDVHAALRLALLDVEVEGRPLQLLDAHSAEQAKALLAAHPDIALILLDVVMESEQAGLALVRHIREEMDNRRVQIVLVTGQPGYAPEREVVSNYKIDGYRLKSELSADKLFVSACAAIRAYQALESLAEQQERLEAQTHSLNEREERLRAIVESAPDAIVLADAGGRVIGWNPGAERMFGYPREEMVGQLLTRLMPQRHHTGHLAGLARLMAGGEPRLLGKVVPVEAVHRDGREFPAELVLGAWRNNGSTLFSAVMRDITERRRIEAELEFHRKHLELMVEQRTAALGEAETRYRTVADFTYDWESWIDPDGRWLYCSPACRRITGYEPEAFITDPALFTAIVLPEDRPLMEHHLHDLDDETGRCDLRYRILRKDGVVRWVEHLCQAVYDANGAYLGRRGSNRDITDRKQQEDALAQAKEAAEAANRAKSVFLANMSHELRTPLNAVLGFAQIMARDSGLSEAHQQELETINRSGKHLLSLINDVLEISRIEAGRTTVHNEPFDLPGTLTTIEEIVRIRAEARGLVLRLEKEGALPPYVSGDASRLRQVLINLLGNAVKYTDRGEVILRVTPCEEPTGLGMVRFEVIDTGPGIAPEDLERVFQPFYQTPSGVAKGEGAGLGLTISREFVRLMGGELTLRSSLGEGSRFAFDLPLPPSEPPLSALRQGRVIGIEGGCEPVRVLVAEDNADNRELMLRLLEGVGFEVRVAPDGRRAVERFKVWHPHFIWMDMRMPEMDGYEATRRIRALPGGREIRIVALTASAFHEDRGAIIAAGCDDMVTKPLDETRLFRTMGDLLGLTYRYEEESRPREATPIAEIDFSVLPQAMREGLVAASEELDEATLRALAEEAKADHPEPAEALRVLIDAFRFDRIIQLCQSGEES